MESQGREKKKENVIIHTGGAAKNSVDGLVVAYTEEQSLKLLFVLSILIIICGFVFKISRIEWLFIVLIISCCTAAELLNTAIENVVDLATQEIHPLAKVAKDTASAAEFVFVFMSAIMLAIIFLPKVIGLF